jgi:UDP-N-acetylmuramate--alanine ligase
MSKFFNQFNRMVMLGVGGTGMRGLANLLQNTNNNIVGTDININQIKTDPNLHNIQLVSQSNIVDDLKSADLVIITDAISDDDPIRQAAFKRGTTILTYHEAIGHFAQDYQTIAVTGAHGKSSTTAFLAKIMIDAGLDPTVLIGAGVPEWGNTNSRQGKSRWFLIEADEYKRHFLSLSPMHIIVTNIDFDHPDYFKSLADVKKAMRDFLHSVHPAGHIISSQQVIKNYIEIFPTRNTIAITFNNEKLPLTTPGILF